MLELGTSLDLAFEGAAMRHCVASYSSRAQTGAVSLWSVRVDGEQRLTVEIHNASRQIVQVRGLETGARPGRSWRCCTVGRTRRR